MAFQCRIVLTTALLCAIEGARIRLKKPQTLGGVRVRNYRADAEDWLVVFKPSVSEDEIQAFCGGGCSFQGHPKKGGVPFAAVHGRTQVEAMLAKHQDQIEILEPDETDIMIPDVESDEPETTTWGLERVGVPGRPSTGLGVHIYVQDTGVRGSHDDFDDRVVPTLDLTSGVLVECQDSDDCAQDRQGHGTHCAATAAGRTYGVASGATVHAVKTLSDQGSGARSWNIAAIDWITASGERPAVISMSLTGSGADPAYTVAIGAATEVGITVVVAAGNYNLDSCNYSPAFAEKAITVGATNNINARAQFSNYGTCNDIMAPGSNVISAGISSDTASSIKRGTSMACPHVSGAAALLLELEPSLTRDQIMARMTERGATGLISGLREGDPDLFLWVSAAPAPAGTPPPAVSSCPEATSSGPDGDGDCRCKSGLYCYEDGSSGCTYSYSATYGYTSRVYFSPSCTACVCE